MKNVFLHSTNGLASWHHHWGSSQWIPNICLRINRKLLALTLLEVSLVHSRNWSRSFSKPDLRLQREEVRALVSRVLPTARRWTGRARTARSWRSVARSAARRQLGPRATASSPVWKDGGSVGNKAQPWTQLIVQINLQPFGAAVVEQKPSEQRGCGFKSSQVLVPISILSVMCLWTGPT